MENEIDLIRSRYAKREIEKDARYNPLLPSVYMGQQELERSLISLIQTMALSPLSEKRVIEIGCGSGTNLLRLIQLGFQAKNLTGNELLENRLAVASANLPQEVQLLLGDASRLDLPENSYDIVYQSTVFSSILDNSLRIQLADKMWSWVKPGGGILWYDFIYNNPRNKDVRGVKFSHIQELFPFAQITKTLISLAPPISRLVTKLHPTLYTLFNMIPFLRTHLLCWIAKKPAWAENVFPDKHLEIR